MVTRRTSKFSRRDKEFEEKVLQIKRVSRKHAGGNRISFTALVAVGDQKGRVGIGSGKAPGVPDAIRKGMRQAKKNLVSVPLKGTTIPHPVEVKYGAARVMLKPAPAGSGLIAGGPVRAVAELAGIRDLSSKILGTRSKATNVKAMMKALGMLRGKAQE